MQSCAWWCVEVLAGGGGIAHDIVIVAEETCAQRWLNVRCHIPLPVPSSRLLIRLRTAARVQRALL